MAELILAFMILLALGFTGTRVAKWLNLPHSVFLVIIGTLGGFWLRTSQPETSAELIHLFPEIILLVLLPPLIFESAYNLNFSDFKKDMFPISVLAVLGLAGSTALVGLGFHYILNLQLLPSLVFGALISATDPVAVVSLFKSIGAPKRLNVLVEGESLLNDGTAIVLFRVLLGASLAPTLEPSLISEGLWQFLFVAGGGVAVGLSLALFMSLLLRLTSTNSAAQLGLTVAAAYISFVLADHYFHVSGVIATMVVGLYLGTRSRLELNKESLHGMNFIWEFLALTANTIVFFAVGLTYDHSLISTSIMMLPAAVGIVYFSRAFVVYTLVPFMNITKLCRPISAAYQTILVWGGLRGGLALGLALLLPHDFPHKQLFLAIATAVVAATLFVNALSIQRLLVWFGLDKLDPLDEDFYSRSLRLVQDRVFSQLMKVSKAGVISEIQLERQKQNFACDLPPRSGNKDLAFRYSMSSLLLKEQHYYDDALTDSSLSKAAYIQLKNSVKNRLLAFQRSGLKGLEQSGLGLNKTNSWQLFLQKFASASRQMKDLAVTLETYMQMRLAIFHSLDDSTKAISQKWLKELDTEIEKFHRLYPIQSTAIQAQFISTSAAASSDTYLIKLYESEIITSAVLSRALSTTEKARQKGENEALRLLNPSLDFLLSRVPIFKSLPEKAILTLARHARRIPITEGQFIVRAGEPGHSLYVVVAGMLEVDLQNQTEVSRPKIFTGDFFGEISLILKQPRSASVIALTPSELIEIDENALNEAMSDFPQLRAEIEAVAKNRQLQ